MDEKKYRASFDSIRFSEDFQERTLELLSRQVQQELSGNKYSPMKKNTWKKAIRATAIACALALVLSISAIAVSNLLKPAEALNELHMFPAVARAFQEDPAAILIDESAVLGDFTVHLLGIAHGNALSIVDFDGKGPANPGSLYVMFAITRNDGTPMDWEDIGFGPEKFGYFGRYLISGYHPRELQLYGGGDGGGVIDGVYYIYDEITNLEVFADHNVYLAFYDPHQLEDVDSDNNRDDPFVMAENGSFSFRESYSLPHALFVLPLDPSKADPEAAEEIVRMKQEAAAMEKAETEARIAAEKSFELKKKMQESSSKPTEK